MNGIYEGKKRFNCRQDTGALLRVMSLIFSSARSKRWSRYVGTEPGSNSRHLAKEELRDSSDTFKLNTSSWKTRKGIRAVIASAPPRTREKCGRDEISVNADPHHRSRVCLSLPIELWFKFSRVAEVFIRAHYFLTQSHRGYFPNALEAAFTVGKFIGHRGYTPTNRTLAC